MKTKRIFLLSLTAIAALASAGRDGIDSIGYSLSLITNTSSGRMAPYMIGSWNGERSIMKNGATIDAAISKPIRPAGRFSWGAGIEILTGYGHDVQYDRYDAETGDWTCSSMRPAAIRLQEIYVEARYRGLYAQAGSKEFHSKIVDDNLSSGDLVRSTNARPIPGVTVGLYDFQDIPFTKGWLQIDGQVMYGKLTDNEYRQKQFNHYNGLLPTDLYYTYKHLYFRTKPSERLSVTFGMQTAGEFGGYRVEYHHGDIRKIDNQGFKLGDVFKMLLPTQGNGNGFYEGNTVGSWSLKVRYLFPDENEVAFYWENFFEDGSGIALRNGMDGLYGISFNASSKNWIDGAVIEYLDFRNQSGPLHWAPGDVVNPSITSEATGGDNYYNNDSFGSYANYGMAIGSPMVMSPIYNADGYPEFVYNRMRGFHAAIRGSIADSLVYKLMAGWQKGYAMGRTPLPHAKGDFSTMVEIGWKADKLLNGLSVKGRLAMDRGELRGDNFGAALTLTYTGILNFNKR